MQPSTALCALFLVACGETDPPAEELADPWAADRAPFRSCEVEVLTYPQGNGTPGAREVIRYNAAGHWVSYEFYDILYKDGDLSYRITQTVDELGRATAIEHDVEPLDEVDAQIDSEWDGLTLVSSTLRSPTGVVPDMQITYQVDDLFRVVRQEDDETPYDGRADSVWQATYESDTRPMTGLGGMRSLQLEPDVADYRRSDGTLIEHTESTFDADGRLATKTLEEPRYGILHVFESTYTYGPDGRRAGREYVCDSPEGTPSDPCPGAWDSGIATHTWTCPE